MGLVPSNSTRWRRRRFWLRAGLTSALVVLAILAIIDHARYHGDDWAAFDGRSFIVSTVISGDTIAIRPTIGGDEIPIRLLGIAAPEASTAATKPVIDWSMASAAFVRNLALGKTVLLELEPTQTRNSDGQLTAYVFLSVEDNLNADIIKAGMAFADPRRPHTLMSPFAEAESDARQKFRGFWSKINSIQMPPWRQEWAKRNHPLAPDVP